MLAVPDELCDLAGQLEADQNEDDRTDRREQQIDAARGDKGFDRVQNFHNRCLRKKDAISIYEKAEKVKPPPRLLLRKNAGKAVEKLHKYW